MAVVIGLATLVLGVAFRWALDGSAADVPLADVGTVLIVAGGIELALAVALRAGAPARAAAPVPRDTERPVDDEDRAHADDVRRAA